ncbi:MAG: PIG-L family deacetylase [Anaerolineales bacterium]|nr:PIG-L family deacetylase [Anaerolineales bacterium]
MSRKLLAFLAHPDDESFGSGGTLAKYAREGVEVHIVIATDGAAGSVEEAYAEPWSWPGLVEPCTGWITGIPATKTTSLTIAIPTRSSMLTWMKPWARWSACCARSGRRW